MGCGSSTDTNLSPNVPQPADTAIYNEASMKTDVQQQSEAPMQPAPQEPPHAPIAPEPQSGDMAMSKAQLDEILKGMDEKERYRMAGELGDAIKESRIEELHELLSNDKGRACVNQKVGERTPLHMAAEESKLEAVELLVERGADVNAKGKEGKTPLHLAACSSRQEIIELLVERGSDVNAKDNEGRTPLVYAAVCSLEAVKLLVERGVEVDPTTEWGTPLTIAALYGHDSIAEYLLSKGASKEKAVETVDFKNFPEGAKDMAENFFVELERVIQNRKEFNIKREELNAMLISSKEPETLPTTCKGVTIGGLKKMKALVQSECEAGRFKEDKSFPDGTHCKGTMKYEELTTTDIVYRYVKDESITGKLRLIDTSLVAPEHKRIPTFFISHAWKGRFSVLLDMIFAYAEKYGLSEEAAIWIDVFSVNQHGSKGCSDFSQAQNQADVQAFNNVVQTCTDGTLVVCDFEMCKTYLRAWCLFEWDWTMYYHGRERLKFLGLSKDQAKSGADMIDVEKADCFKAEDKEMILREIVGKHGSTQVFNNKLKTKWALVAGFK